MIARERRAQTRLAPYVPVFKISDFIRTSRQQIAASRTLASTIGHFEPVWAVLDQIATKERFVSMIEAELDDALEHYR
jgi:hypothetical protein